MKILFVEPPKEFWFVMGEYLPPPYGILQLASYLEQNHKDIDIKVIDCQAHSIEWKELEREIALFDPDIFACSGLATCNTYVAARAFETAKKVKASVLTVAGGQHFTALAEESLNTYSDIDIIVRGEGEVTLSELVKVFSKRESFQQVSGISFRQNGKVVNNPSRPLIKNLDDLPYPAYHFVEDVVNKYHFKMMAGSKKGFMIIEGSRGCEYTCSFCTQWRHWKGCWRVKSAKRIVDEFELCYKKYGVTFLWLTDDNFPLDDRANDICDEIIKRGLGDKIMWFVQTRCDEIIKNPGLLPKLKQSGNKWILIGAENNRPSVLEDLKKNITPENIALATKLVKENGIFCQLTFIIGNRTDSSESIGELRKFVDNVNPDLAIFMILTPFPGSEIFEDLKGKDLITDYMWTNYDMVHAVMPTETLSIEQVHEELYLCYRSFYGSWKRKLFGFFSRNKIKRRTYRYMATQGLLKQLKNS